MQQYELLFVLPGTLTEAEVVPVVDAVKTAVVEKGGTVKSMDDMGKSRLAYPMNHIRYGYFRLCRFDAEPTQMPLIEQKLRLNNDLLRILLKKQGKGAVAPVQFVSPISSVEREQPREQESVGMEPRKEAPMPEMHVAKEAAPVAETHSASSPRPELGTKAGQAKKIQLEDIDKKLDEILEKDIADQL